MIATELKDITFTGKQGEISLASFGLHVEKQGLNSIFNLPSYTNINSVDWQEYDGEDVDFSTASVSPVQMQIKVFGEKEEIDALLDQISIAGLDRNIILSVKIKEDTFNNAINFSCKFNGATKGKAVIENDWRLEYFLLTDEDSDYIANETDAILQAGVMVKRWRDIAFVTLTFTRHDNAQYFGLLGDNTKACQGIPNESFDAPETNMPIEFRRYHLSNRTATQVSTFNLYNNFVYCYPLKGAVQGITGIAERKTPFTIQTENMVGEVMETKNSDKRRSKTISLPLLIRSHSVSAIFKFLGTYKSYVHNTLKGGDMLYLHSEHFGDFAVYPTGCNVTKAYIKDQPWLEISLQFSCYKEGFDFTATTDNSTEDNPDPILPPAPAPTFDPYSGITKSSWQVCSFSASGWYSINIPYLVTPDTNKTNYSQYPLRNPRQTYSALVGWSLYTEYIDRFPVGTLFFAKKNSYVKNEQTIERYITVVCLPWSYDNLKLMLGYMQVALGIAGYQYVKIDLVGVVQGCDVMSKNISGWSSTLQESPKYGGIVGGGTVRVHTKIKGYLDEGRFTVASGLTLTTSDDYDLLINNTISTFNEDQQGAGYYTEIGFANTKK